MRLPLVSIRSASSEKSQPMVSKISVLEERCPMDLGNAAWNSAVRYVARSGIFRGDGSAHKNWRVNI